MGYQKYGISPELVGEVKQRMKQPAVKDRIVAMLDGITKTDLQSKPKIRKLLSAVTKEIGMKLSDTESANIVRFVLDQKIDPKNTFHLIKLWGMFR